MIVNIPNVKSIPLLPRPRHLSLSGESVKVPSTLSLFSIERGLARAAGIVATEPACTEAHIIIETDLILGQEEYHLFIGETTGCAIKIRSSSRIGSLHALKTLRQLLDHFGTTLPAMQIEDSPAFANRGIMLDVSRNRVPKMSELLRLVRQFASWKINHIQLYTEHTFKYLGHDEVWRGASPLTPLEIRLLDKECRELGITLAANQNCFGHMTRWLKHPRYASLAETHGDWEWEGRMLPGPFSLCPLDPGSIDLVDGLLEQLLPNFSSGLVNIGCDETLDLGQGRSKDEVAKRGESTLYFDFVDKIVARVKKRGFKPMFWADIALSHPEELHRVPDGMISLAWGYEPDAPFAEWCKRLRDVGSEVWVCPGTSSWRSITGRTTERRQNVSAAVEQGLASGASGFLMTDWGDEGHRQQWPIALIGLAEAAEAAWSGKSEHPDNETLDKHLFSGSKGVAQWLCMIGDADLPLRRIYGKPTTDGLSTPLRNSSALFNEMHRPELPRPLTPHLSEVWHETLSSIKELSANIPLTDPQTTSELLLTADVAELAANIALLNVNPNSGKIFSEELVQNIDRIIIEHSRLWRLRSRPGGLAESVTHYKKVKRRLMGLTS